MKTLHLPVCMCVSSFCIFVPVFMYACVYVRVYVSAFTSLWDISIGRPILSSLWVDFKGEEILAGFSRLVNSSSPESGVFWSFLCTHVCVYTSSSVSTCVYVHAPVSASSCACIDWYTTELWLFKIILSILKDQIPSYVMFVAILRCIHVSERQWYMGFVYSYPAMYESIRNWFMFMEKTWSSPLSGFRH